MINDFQEKGYVVVPNLLSEKEVKENAQCLENMSGFSQHIIGDNTFKWNMPGGVSRTPEFWRLILS